MKRFGAVFNDPIKNGQYYTNFNSSTALFGLRFVDGVLYDFRATKTLKLHRLNKGVFPVSTEITKANGESLMWTDSVSLYGGEAPGNQIMVINRRTNQMGIFNMDTGESKILIGDEHNELSLDPLSRETIHEDGTSKRTTSKLISPHKAIMGESGNIYFTEDDRVAVAVKNKDGSYEVRTIFTQELNNKECGIGTNELQVSYDDQKSESKLNSAISVICTGEAIIDLKVYEKCSDPENGYIKMAFSQGFDDLKKVTLSANSSLYKTRYISIW